MAKRRRRRNLKEPEGIETLIGRAGENRFAKRRVVIPVADWRAAVGPRIADRARPVSLERGVLVVMVATSVWASELSMLAGELVARLLARGVAVTSLRFRVGSMDPVDRPPERRTTRRIPPPAPLPEGLKEDVLAIADDELRAIISAAASANLAWQDFTVKQPVVRVPRVVERGIAQPARIGGASDEASTRSSGGERGRQR